MPVDLAFDAVGDGPPLLILHGVFGSATNWRSIAKALAPAMRAICVDLRNHGASPWAATMSYPEMADDVAALIEAQGLQRPAVMGHSMGGKVAMTLALTRPELVGRLVLVDIAPVAYDDRMTRYVEAMHKLPLAESTTRSQARDALLQSIPDVGVVGFLLQNLVQRDGRLQWRIALEAIGNAMPQIRSFPDELRQRVYDGPSAAIVGERSDYVVPPEPSAFAPMFPGITVERIADAGHWVHADQPQAFAAAARRALGLPDTAG